MTDQLNTAVGWLAGMMSESMARTVTYARGEDTVEIAATVGRTEFLVAGDDGSQFAVESRDYVFTAEDLVLDETVTLPERGDRITDTVAGAEHVYEVMAPGGLQHFRLSGPDNNLCRVHTNLIERGS